jgi:NAD(P)-dependent dehydrogenase (short-subunit alcohol dehydrogenase family)
MQPRFLDAAQENAISTKEPCLMQRSARPLAIITGASTGIGYELAKCCAQDGYNLVVIADEAEINRAAETSAHSEPMSTHCRPTSPVSMASTSFTKRLADAQWTHF